MLLHSTAHRPRSVATTSNCCRAQPSWTSCGTLAGQIRQQFYKVTLPWSDEGFRLLPAHFYFDLTTEMRVFEHAFESKVEEFLAVYPDYIEQVRPALNGLFSEEDYPSVKKLRKKFGIKLEVPPIPTGEDFRVSMSAEERARVAREIDANVRQSLQRGTEDLWNRMKDVVSRLAARLQDPNGRYTTSMVSNVCDLADLLPKLNVSQDADLNRFAAEIRSRLCNYSAHELKNNDVLRVAPQAMPPTSSVRWTPYCGSASRALRLRNCQPSHPLTRSSLTWLTTCSWSW